MALVGKTCASGNFGQAGSTATNEHCALQSQMHDIAVRCDANRSGEHAREVE
jgi:hypothetical protein